MSSDGPKSKTTKRATVGLFSGLIRCADCGSALAYQRRQRKDKEIGVYRCSRYNNNGSGACTTHDILEDTITDIVVQDIRRYAVFAAYEREQLTKRLLAVLNKNRNGELRGLQGQQRDAENRLNVIAARIKSLYEDKCLENLPENVFTGLVADFTKEQAELEEKLPELRSRISKLMETEQEVSVWTSLISRHIDIETLDRATAMELIEYILVSDGERVGKKRQQGIRIKYRFVGCIDEQPMETVEPTSSGDNVQKKTKDIA